MLDDKAFAEPEPLWNVPMIDASLTGVAYPNCALIVATRATTSASVRKMVVMRRGIELFLSGAVDPVCREPYVVPCNVAAIIQIISERKQPFMIKEVAGDLLLSKAHAIAHGIAPNDDFKQGLALSLREQWPGMYKDFRHYCQTYNPKPGTLWSWKGPGSPIIINLFAQEPAEDQGGETGQSHDPVSQPCPPSIEERTQGTTGDKSGSAAVGHRGRRSLMG